MLPVPEEKQHAFTSIFVLAQYPAPPLRGRVRKRLAVCRDQLQVKVVSVMTARPSLNSTAGFQVYFFVERLREKKENIISSLRLAALVVASSVHVLKHKPYRYSFRLQLEGNLQTRPAPDACRPNKRLKS